MSINNDLISMFLLGLVGTGHCIGMCGPLVFAFPGSTGKFASHLWYHAGRLGTYTLVGALLGGIEDGLINVLGRFASEPMAAVVWIQFGLSFFAAAFLLLFGLVRFGLLSEPALMKAATPERYPVVGRLLRATLLSPKGPNLLILGLLMGLIPCGLSYAAFARALPSGNMVDGALLLLAFGLGTLPGLLLLGTGVSKLFRKYQTILDLLAGLAMIAISVRLLLNALQAI